MMSEIKKRPLEYIEHLSNINKSKPGPSELESYNQEREENF